MNMYCNVLRSFLYCTDNMILTLDIWCTFITVSTSLVFGKNLSWCFAKVAAACGKMSTEQIDEMLQVGAVPSVCIWMHENVDMWSLTPQILWPSPRTRWNDENCIGPLKIHHRFSALRTCRIQSKTCFVESRIWRALSWSCWCIKQKKLGSSDLYNQSKNARDDSDRDIIELDFIIPSSFGNMTSLTSLRNCLHLLFKRAFLCCKHVSPCNTQLGALMSMSCHPKQSCSPFKPLALLKRRHSWFKRCKCVSTRHDDAVEILGEIRGCSIRWFLFANIFYILLFWLVKQHICIIWYTEVIWNPTCVRLWMALSADSFSSCFQFVKCV